MTSYVVEVGIKSGEGEFTQWESDGFYGGYVANGGPMILTDRAGAFRFATHEIASRIPSGDPRLNGRHRIVPTSEEPNV